MRDSMYYWWINQSALDGLHVKQYLAKYGQTGDVYYLSLALSYARSLESDLDMVRSY